MKQLKKRIKNANMSIKEVAVELGLRYSTLGAYLNEFVMMPEHIRRKIDDILKTKERGRS